ncbi:MAG TPA: type II toxin-antitoxin system VapC family toxin [Streptosporangiaceae bacterium]|jgi:predicted nucleic acid-binding protein|nr:type II toxin-antitoxin system VapC family toxin [Streptosporangiaceae bacterium]
MIVLDACVLIAHFDAEDALHEDARNLLRSVADEPFRTSPLTQAEVLAGPARAGRLDRAVAALAQLDVRTVSMETDAPMRLAMLRAETGLKLPDCCVLLAAEHVSDAQIATFDDQLCAVARQRGFAALGRRSDIPNP